MKDIMRMKRDRHTVVLEMRELLDAVEKRDDKKMTDEEEVRYRELDMKQARAGIDIEEEEARQNVQTYKSGGVPVEPDDFHFPTSKRFSDMFPGAVDNGGFKDRNDFWGAVFSSRHDARLESRVAMTGSGPLGGFAVPDIVGKILWDRVLEKSIVLKRAQLWPMTSQKLTVPAFDSQNASADLYGFVGQWISEGDAGVEQNPRLRALSLELKKLGIYTSITRELLAFGNGFGEALETAISRCVSWYSDKAYINGSGVGQPLGVLNSPCTLVVSREVDNQISYADVLAMYSKLLHGSGKAVWLTNQSTLPQLLNMADSGDNLIVENITDGIFGLPIVLSEHLPVLGTKGDLALVDFSAYSIGKYKDLFIDSTNSFRFLNDETTMRCILLTDGQPVFSKPITDGSGNVVSPFVVLGDAAAAAE